MRLESQPLNARAHCKKTKNTQKSTYRLGFYFCWRVLGCFFSCQPLSLLNGFIRFKNGIPGVVEVVAVPLDGPEAGVRAAGRGHRADFFDFRLLVE